MPLFPQGLILSPNSIDNTLLTDMAAGTVKGRPVGAGLGDPVDLTSAQLAAIAAGSDIPFAQCRLDFVSTTAIALNRRNGKYLTINNAVQAIPAAGVPLAYSAFGLGPDNLGSIYAYMNGVVMALEASATAPTVDPVSGMIIKTGDPTRTYVGQARSVTGTFRDDQTFRFVQSWFNQLPCYSYGFVNALTTAFTTPAILTAAAYHLAYTGQAVELFFAGHTSPNPGPAWCSTVFFVNNVQYGNQVANYCTVTGGANGATLAMPYEPTANTMLTLQLGGSVSAGTGTWSGGIYIRGTR